VIPENNKIFWKTRQLSETKKYLLDIKRGGVPVINVLPINEMEKNSEDGTRLRDILKVQT
jgi:hypothetical protein